MAANVVIDVTSADVTDKVLVWADKAAQRAGKGKIINVPAPVTANFASSDFAPGVGGRVIRFTKECGDIVAGACLLALSEIKEEIPERLFLKEDKKLELDEAYSRSEKYVSKMSATHEDVFWLSQSHSSEKSSFPQESEGSLSFSRFEYSPRQVRGKDSVALKWDAETKCASLVSYQSYGMI